MQNTSVSIITLNTRGLHRPRKCYATYSYIKRQQAQIAFLQETHLTAPEQHKLQVKWRGTLCAMSYSPYARGALIWLRPGTPFQETRRVVDKDGRYALLEGLLDGQSVLLGSVYAPNVEQDGYWDTLTGILAQFASVPWILGGDYNCALDITLDRSHLPPPHSPHRSRRNTFSVGLHIGH